MEEKITKKYIAEIERRRKARKPIYLTRKERASMLIKIGALVDMLGLSGKSHAYLLGLLLQHFKLSDKEREEYQKYGEEFLLKKKQADQEKKGKI